jgi:peptidoglycan/xylan/chitin deacetylase (PgdA/CDA1 family)
LQFLARSEVRARRGDGASPRAKAFSVRGTRGIFCRKDFDQFLLQGHELGCHTFDHCDSWNTAPAEFEASILRNQQIVARELPTLNMRSLSYPISYPRPQTKCRVAKHFRCARFGGQIFNKGFTDLNYLKSFLIEQSRDDFAAIQGMIQANFSNRGWLIFTTHDVCASPSRFGCTPALFAKIVNSVSRSGATVLPVNEAFSAILGRPLPSQC